MKIEYMQIAVDAAKNSGEDIPVGAVIVKDGKIIAQAVNKREKEQITVYHAEIISIMEANKKLNNWRLTDCEMYVTLEPCPMCASAIIQARISKLYFGAYDVINGAFGSKTDMREIMNCRFEVKGGIMEEECTKIIHNYFERMRH